MMTKMEQTRTNAEEPIHFWIQAVTMEMSESISVTTAQNQTKLQYWFPEYLVDFIISSDFRLSDGR